MGMIKRIFLTDLKNLITNFFALVIVVGVGFLPALYAWFNIYSNWDPYGNTGNLKMAAVSLDEGWVNDDGEALNTGDTIIDNLHENTAIDWQFVDSEEEALEGVKDGRYYGAIVVPADFTYNMYNVFIEDVSKPTLIFYQNQKKNPVATKISDTVVETLQTNMDEAFVKVMTETVFSDAKDMVEDMEENGGTDALLSRLESVNDDIVTYQAVIDEVIKSNASLNSSINTASGDIGRLESGVMASAATINNAASSVAASQATLNQYTTTVNGTMNTIGADINDVTLIVNDETMKKDVQGLTDATTKTLADVRKINADLAALSAAMAGDYISDDATKATLNAMVGVTATMAETLSKALEQSAQSAAAGDAEAARAALNLALNQAANDAVALQNQYNGELMPQINTTLDNLRNVTASASNLMNNISGTLKGMGQVLDALKVTVSSADTSLLSTKDTLGLLGDRLSDTLAKARTAREDERVQLLVDTFTGDPDVYGEFFSEPVKITTEAIYPVENYGSSVAPFYTTLAIWVGALLLTAIIKVRPKEELYPDARPYQKYLGRYLIFFAVGQLQTVITVLGDFYILKIQCLHPFLFWLASAMTSLTFSILIYSLVLAFGDVGKALAVVLVVLQIAGSSGTYPIELLPEFFRNVYIFFPFPYAINALRECIGGMYASNYQLYLLELSVFIIVSLAIGLWIRQPFEELMEFMEKRMEETEMM